jgi:undecaprenyl-diphosphatase
MKPATQFNNRDRLLNILFFLALLLFIVIARYVYVYPENIFDRYIEEQSRPLASPAFLPLWIGLSFFGSFQFLFPAYVVFIVINVWRRKRRFGLSVAVVATGVFLTVQILKQLFHRHRPDIPLIPDVIDYSFPSGHSASSLVFCAVIAWSVWHSTNPRSLRITGFILTFLLTCFIGLSRIVLAVHHPTDVAAGFCVGTVWCISWLHFNRK